MRLPGATHHVLGFQYRAEADRFLAESRERLRKFGLELHPDKTHRIEFGRFAEQDRKRRGEGKPETFDFLGFTHISGKDRNGNFAVKRHTMGKRLRGKLAEIKQHSATNARTGGHNGEVAQVGRARLLQLSRGTGQYRCPSRVPLSGDPAVAAGSDPSRPEGLSKLGENASTEGAVDPGSARPTSLSPSSLRRHSSKIRASCGNTARGDLCGGIGQPISLPRLGHQTVQSMEDEPSQVAAGRKLAHVLDILLPAQQRRGS